MNRRKALLWIEALLCAALCCLLAAGALRLYFGGTADGTEWLYTREKAVRTLRPALPLLLAILGLAVLGRAMGLKAESLPQAGPLRAPAAQKTPSEARLRAARLALLVAALALILAGILNGSMRDVLYKAINICTECVGLG